MIDLLTDCCQYSSSRNCGRLFDELVCLILQLQNGYTPLHIAARKNELEIAQLLLDQKTDPGALSKVHYLLLKASSHDPTRRIEFVSCRAV